MTNKRILLVEDYPANVLVATTLLQEFGYEFDVAASGQEALNLIEHKHFGAALMDVRLADEMCGFETTRRIRAIETQKGSKRLPIIAMTASAMVGDREKCIEAGMDDYISKPFDPDELKFKLDSIAA